MAARAAATAGVLARWRRFISDRSVAQALAFAPAAGDVMIATHSKAGTTLLQQIVHALRGGAADFDEISEVVPVRVARAWAHTPD